MTRIAALHRSSNEFLRAAVSSRRRGSAAVSVVSLATQAGYIALLSALEESDVRAARDHPSATLATRAAQRLQLSAEDRHTATALAETYFAAGADRPVCLPADCIRWAMRVRKAVGWMDK